MIKQKQFQQLVFNNSIKSWLQYNSKLFGIQLFDSISPSVVLQRKITKFMYKNRICFLCFFLNFIIQNEQVGRVWRVFKTTEM